MLAFVGDYIPQTDFRRPDAMADDVFVANLECVIGDISLVRENKAHSVVFDESVMPLVADSGVSAFNLANNHVYDAGSQAFDAMVDRFSEQPEIQLYGIKDRPYASLNVGGNSIAVIGCLERCRARGPRLVCEEDVSAIVRDVRSRFDRVYVTPHWGKEGELAYHPSPQQIRRGKEWIDAGVDGVFGHHSHTIHGAQHKSKPIYYSLGNYQFDHIEGRKYPLAAYGLIARINPADSSVQRFYVHQHAAGAVEVDSGVHRKLEQHFVKLSQDIENWSNVKWARHVGPVYISKSMNSWKTRLKRNLLKTLPLFAVWSLLPSTLLLQLGSLFQAPDCSRRVAELGKVLPGRPG